uniref:NADAR domain-containing protein n=1 Tax=Cryptomonas curvata TaxID=233186 RepID=A0A7S0M1A4_9CRYP|mmetsp:Transcript_20088/g.42124  ORF Transcript_20088/g.42124 Transcript_20088/m.42124 type:complete len:186 (+) Transcript_20088:31-588(+)
MGGPCFVVDESGKKRIGPACTDNFQVRRFVVDGVEYYSCEHAYQALKFIPGSRQDAVRCLRPYVGENDSAFGMRCWSEGQRGSVRDDWDAIKVGVMFAVNEAKYMQHEDLQRELISTGQAKIVGGPSTSWTVDGKFHNWNCWNGLIQMRLREQLRLESDRVPGVLESLIADFDAYSAAASRASRL